MTDTAYLPSDTSPNRDAPSCNPLTNTAVLTEEDLFRIPPILYKGAASILLYENKKCHTQSEPTTTTSHMVERSGGETGVEWAGILPGAGKPAPQDDGPDATAEAHQGEASWKAGVHHHDTVKSSVEFSPASLLGPDPLRKASPSEVDVQPQKREGNHLLHWLQRADLLRASLEQRHQTSGEEENKEVPTTFLKSDKDEGEKKGSPLLPRERYPSGMTRFILYLHALLHSVHGPHGGAGGSPSSWTGLPQETTTTTPDGKQKKGEEVSAFLAAHTVEEMNRRMSLWKEGEIDTLLSRLEEIDTTLQVLLRMDLDGKDGDAPNTTIDAARVNATPLASDTKDKTPFGSCKAAPTHGGILMEFASTFSRNTNGEKKTNETEEVREEGEIFSFTHWNRYSHLASWLEEVIGNGPSLSETVVDVSPASQDGTKEKEEIAATATAAHVKTTKPKEKEEKQDLLHGLHPSVRRLISLFIAKVIADARCGAVLSPRDPRVESTAEEGKAMMGFDWSDMEILRLLVLLIPLAHYQFASIVALESPTGGEEEGEESEKAAPRHASSSTSTPGAASCGLLLPPLSSSALRMRSPHALSRRTLRQKAMKGLLRLLLQYVDPELAAHLEGCHRVDVGAVLLQWIQDGFLPSSSSFSYAPLHSRWWKEGVTAVLDFFFLYFTTSTPRFLLPYVVLSVLLSFRTVLLGKTTRGTYASAAPPSSPTTLPLPSFLPCLPLACLALEKTSIEEEDALHASPSLHSATTRLPMPPLWYSFFTEAMPSERGLSAPSSTSVLEANRETSEESLKTSYVDPSSSTYQEASRSRWDIRSGLEEEKSLVRLCPFPLPCRFFQSGVSSPPLSTEGSEAPSAAADDSSVRSLFLLDLTSSPSWPFSSLSMQVWWHHAARLYHATPYSTQRTLHFLFSATEDVSGATGLERSISTPDTSLLETTTYLPFSGQELPHIYEDPAQRRRHRDVGFLATYYAALPVLPIEDVDILCYCRPGPLPSCSSVDKEEGEGFWTSPSHRPFRILDCRRRRSVEFARLPHALFVGDLAAASGVEPKATTRLLSSLAPLRGDYLVIFGTGRGSYSQPSRTSSSGYSTAMPPSHPTTTPPSYLSSQTPHVLEEDEDRLLLALTLALVHRGKLPFVGWCVSGMEGLRRLIYHRKLELERGPVVLPAAAAAVVKRGGGNGDKRLPTASSTSSSSSSSGLAAVASTRRGNPPPPSSTNSRGGGDGNGMWNFFSSTSTSSASDGKTPLLSAASATVSTGATMIETLSQWFRPSPFHGSSSSDPARQTSGKEENAIRRGRAEGSSAALPSSSSSFWLSTRTHTTTTSTVQGERKRNNINSTTSRRVMNVKVVQPGSPSLSSSSSVISSPSQSTTRTTGTPISYTTGPTLTTRRTAAPTSTTLGKNKKVEMTEASSKETVLPTIFTSLMGPDVFVPFFPGTTTTTLPFSTTAANGSTAGGRMLLHSMESVSTMTERVTSTAQDWREKSEKAMESVSKGVLEKLKSATTVATTVAGGATTIGDPSLSLSHGSSAAASSAASPSSWMAMATRMVRGGGGGDNEKEREKVDPMESHLQAPVWGPLRSGATGGSPAPSTAPAVPPTTLEEGSGASPEDAFLTLFSSGAEEAEGGKEEMVVEERITSDGGGAKTRVGLHGGVKPPSVPPQPSSSAVPSHVIPSRVDRGATPPLLPRLDGKEEGPEETRKKGTGTSNGGEIPHLMPSSFTNTTAERGDDVGDISTGGPRLQGSSTTTTTTSSPSVQHSGAKSKEVGHSSPQVGIENKELGSPSAADIDELFEEMFGD